MATITKPEIQAASVARGQDKITHETFYVVKSDSSETDWYTIRWNNERLTWQCNGDKCRFQADGTRCKHVRAVGGQVPAIVARMQADEDKRQAARRLSREEYIAEFAIYE